MASRDNRRFHLRAKLDTAFAAIKASLSVDLLMHRRPDNRPKIGGYVDAGVHVQTGLSQDVDKLLSPRTKD